MILNKSDIQLDQYDKEVISKGLNFAPTPAWGRSVENNEWHNAYQHIRREEWRALLGDESEMSNPLPKKLKIPKNSRPHREQLDEKTNAYVDMVLSKLRKLKEVQKNYRKKNNLPKEQRNSLNKLNCLVKNSHIVICSSDKDGKIVILNYEDYNSIRLRELRFRNCDDGWLYRF